MHQERSIPWHLLSTNVKFVHDNSGFTPPYTGFTILKAPVPTRPQHPKPRSPYITTTTTHTPDLLHFTRKLASTIRTFSDTERTKYPLPSTFQQTALEEVYSDTFKARYPDFLNDDRQNVESWMKRASIRRDAQDGDTGYYSTPHGDLADVIKVLFAESCRPVTSGSSSRRCTLRSSTHLNEEEDEGPDPHDGSDDAGDAEEKQGEEQEKTKNTPDLITALLELANHPSIPLYTLIHLSWGHHFGLSRVMESALRSYILLNLIISMSTNDPRIFERGAYWDMQVYRGIVRQETQSMDFPGQQIPHRAFWEGAKRASAGVDASSVLDVPLFHTDLSALHAYLNPCFSLLYKYDMVVRECGRDPEWMREIGYVSEMLVKGVVIVDDRQGAAEQPIPGRRAMHTAQNADGVTTNLASSRLRPQFKSMFI